MAGKRYFAFGGIRDRGEDTNFPYITIMGPSGQMVQVPYPKGYTDDTQFTPTINQRIPTTQSADGSNIYGAGQAKGLAGYEHTFSHVQIEWFRNHIANSYVDGATQNHNCGMAFQPYGQPASGNYLYHPSVPLLNTPGRGRPQINSNEDAGGNGNFNPVANTEYLSRVMQDGFNWIMPFFYNPTGFREMMGFKRIPGGGLLWVYKTAEAESYTYGLWTAQLPLLKFVSSNPNFSPFPGQAGSGWKGEGGQVGEPRIGQDPRYTVGFGGAPGGIDNYCGVKMGGNQQMFGFSTNVHDIVFHKGHAWVTTQYNTWCMSPGGRQSLVNDERATDTHGGGISSKDQTEDYESRREANTFGGPASRSLASHDGELYMLNNLGKLFLVRPGGIRELADLSELGTFSSSGVFGGALADQPLSIETWGGTSVYRCKLVTFNDQLHAFLNFQSTHNVGKAENGDQPGVGRGILWATSTDGVNWQDQSSLLPASGIVKPSGVQLQWEGKILPYRFSGTPGKVFPSGVLPDGNNTLDYPDTAGMAGASGFNQSGDLHIWASGVGYRNSFDVDVGASGVLLDDEGTPFDQLRVPLAFGRNLLALYPTVTINPAGWGFINEASGRLAAVPLASGSGGVYAPSGVGASGLDYTGCRNYHVSAVVDEVDNTLRVVFSEDFDGGALIYKLNKASGWSLTNHVRDSKQLNGIVPIDLYDPEVIISSGTMTKPNPSHDPVNKTITIDYEVLDWPFWRPVDVEMEYSVDDGRNWESIGTTKAVSTGSFATDPSGIIGNKSTFVWEYSDHTRPRPLSPSTFYASVQVRMRGRDATFINPV